MHRNPGLLPDEDGYEPDDGERIEMLTMTIDDVLCAFILSDVDPAQRVGIQRYWAEVVMPSAITAMTKFAANHRGD